MAIGSHFVMSIDNQKHTILLGRIVLCLNCVEKVPNFY